MLLVGAHYIYEQLLSETFCDLFCKSSAKAINNAYLIGLFCQFRYGRHCAFGYTHYLLKIGMMVNLKIKLYIFIIILAYQIKIFLLLSKFLNNLFKIGKISTKTEHIHFVKIVTNICALAILIHTASSQHLNFNSWSLVYSVAEAINSIRAHFRILMMNNPVHVWMPSMT